MSTNVDRCHLNFDEYRQAVGMLNPMSDKVEGMLIPGGEGETSVSRALLVQKVATEGITCHYNNG